MADGGVRGQTRVDDVGDGLCSRTHHSAVPSPRLKPIHPLHRLNLMQCNFTIGTMTHRPLHWTLLSDGYLESMIRVVIFVVGRGVHRHDKARTPVRRTVFRHMVSHIIAIPPLFRLARRSTFRMCPRHTKPTSNSWWNGYSSQLPRDYHCPKRNPRRIRDYDPPADATGPTSTSN